jgi:hypothetical protein
MTRYVLLPNILKVKQLRRTPCIPLNHSFSRTTRSLFSSGMPISLTFRLVQHLNRTVRMIILSREYMPLYFLRLNCFQTGHPLIKVAHSRLVKISDLTARPLDVNYAWTVSDSLAMMLCGVHVCTLIIPSTVKLNSASYNTRSPIL